MRTVFTQTTWRPRNKRFFLFRTETNCNSICFDSLLVFVAKGKKKRFRFALVFRTCSETNQNAKRKINFYPPNCLRINKLYPSVSKWKKERTVFQDQTNIRKTGFLSSNGRRGTLNSRRLKAQLHTVRFSHMPFMSFFSTFFYFFGLSQLVLGWFSYGNTETHSFHIQAKQPKQKWNQLIGIPLRMQRQGRLWMFIKCQL